MPNTSSSVPFLLSSSMQSIRSRRTSTCLSSGPLGSGSGLLQQLGSGMVRQLTSGSGTASPVHHQYNGNLFANNSNNASNNNLNNTGPHTSRVNYVRKCPSLNITFSNWRQIKFTVDTFYANNKLVFLPIKFKSKFNLKSNVM